MNEFNLQSELTWQAKTLGVFMRQYIQHFGDLSTVIFTKIMTKM